MKIKHILFPVDFSESSHALIPEVEWVANKFDSDVTLMHVFEIPIAWYGTVESPMMSPPCCEELRGSAKQRLLDYPIRLAENRVNRVFAEGDAAWNIKNWVEEHDVDLIMMGTHGYGSLRRLLLGPVAMKLLHDVGRPVWTHSHCETDSLAARSISKIICALELTQEAVPLVRFANELAQECGACVRIIHAVPEIEFRPYRYLDMDLHKFLKECAAKDIAHAQREAGTDFPVTITDGLIGTETAALATDQQADLIVIGREKPRTCSERFARIL